METANTGKNYAHWVERLAAEIAEKNTPPLVIASGITTSGQTHLGTLCEFLYPHALYLYLAQKYPTKFYFIADILDAFDSVPAVFSNYTDELTPHLGKPLAHVPDPTHSSSSFGEHFLNEVKSLMKKFDISPEILTATELYDKGNYDEYARLFLKKSEEVKNIVALSSLKKEMSKDWSPLMPICQNCGKIATTRTTSYDETTDTYSYACDKDVGYTKGCGFSGENKISEHKYKITWRLDWPTRQHFLKVSAEGSGVDHMTRGGSWDTAKEIHEKIFKSVPPTPYKFGFILFQGKKYSKSKGIGMGVSELVQMLPTEIIKYLLLKPDIEENIDINPTGPTLMKLMDDFTQASQININDENLSRADRKRAIAFSLSTKKLHWKPATSLSDLLIHRQLHRDWGVIAEKVGDDEGARYLQPYVEKWLEKKMVPDEYEFSFTPQPITDDIARKFLLSLKPGMSALEIHNLAFNTAKENNIEPNKLFTLLYSALLNKPKGPRLGKLIEAIGVERVKSSFNL